MNKRLLSVLVIVILMIFALFPLFLGKAQNQGSITINGDTEMIGINEIGGGGHITWTLTGDEARDFRRYLLQMFDDRNGIPCYFEGIQLVEGECYDYKRLPGPANGLIDENELAWYLYMIDLYLGRSFTETNLFRFYDIIKVDKLYDTAETSTEGLIGTGWDSEEPIEINFIYNSNAPAGRLMYQLAEIDAVTALYEPFSVRFIHSFNGQNRLFSYKDWHRTQRENYEIDSVHSLWYGNETTGQYEYNMSSSTNISIDLRYASQGSVSFKYKGSVADSGDHLYVNISDDNETTWTTIQDFSIADNTDVWTTFEYDVSSHIGKKLVMEFEFVSNAAGNDQGFFIDHFAIIANSTYNGLVNMGHVDYVVGLASFSEPRVEKNSPHIIRPLGGEILIYSSTYDANSIPEDIVAYDSFNALENPAILFIIMFICLWFMVSFPNRFYSDYRLAHDPKDRPKATKIAWLHWLGRILIILILLFYFFPTIFVAIGLNVFIGGLAMILFCVLSLVGMSLGSKLLYDRKIKLIPVIEKEAEPIPGALVCPVCTEDIVEDQPFICECGTQYHSLCASKLENCTACGALVAPVEEEMVPVECPSCTEISVVPASADLLRQTCPHCGSILKALDKGYNYLIIDETPDLTYAIFNIYINKNVPTLCLSTRPEDKLRKEYNLGETEIYWITTMGTGEFIVDPKRLDFEIMRAISKFMKDNEEGIILIDGVEYLIAENGFDATSAFLKKINDMASVNNITLLIPVNPSIIEKDKLSALRREYDRVENFTEEPEGIAPPPVPPAAPPPTPPPETPPPEEPVEEEEEKEAETEPEEAEPEEKEDEKEEEKEEEEEEPRL